MVGRVGWLRCASLSLLCWDGRLVCSGARLAWILGRGSPVVCLNSRRSGLAFGRSGLRALGFGLWGLPSGLSLLIRSVLGLGIFALCSQSSLA